jgi:hypothetical protein
MDDGSGTQAAEVVMFLKLLQKSVRVDEVSEPAVSGTPAI